MDDFEDTFESTFGSIDYSDPDSGDLMEVRDEDGRLPFELANELSFSRRSNRNMELHVNDVNFYSTSADEIKHYRSLGFEVLGSPPPPIVFIASRPFSLPVLRVMASLARVMFVEILDTPDGTFVGILSDLLASKGTTWIYPRNEAIFRKCLDSHGYKCISSFDVVAQGYCPKVVPDCTVGVFFEPTGPERSDVRTFLGHGERGPFTANSDGTTYYSMTQTDLVPVFVPPYIKHLWLCKTYPSIHQKLSEADFYKRQGESFAVWGFPLHKEQLTLLVSQISSDWIAFPGDGCGSGMAVASTRAVSGDPYINTLTDPRVKEEDALMTVRRCMDLEGTKTIVFSYCQQFVSDADLKTILELGSPVIFLEASDACQRRCSSLGFHVISHGPCLFSYGYNGRLYVPVVDRIPDHGTILYSENLLQHNYCVHSWNSVCDYLWSMRPFAPIGYSEGYSGIKMISPRGTPTHFLAVSFEDLEFGIKKQALPVYFYPSGCVISDIISVSHVTSHSFKSRQPYKSFDPVFNAWIRKQDGILVHEAGLSCFFCSIRDVHSSLYWEEKQSRIAWRRTVSFLKDPDPDKLLYFCDRKDEVTFWFKGATFVYLLKDDLMSFLDNIRAASYAHEVVPFIVSLKAGLKAEG